MKSLRLQIFGIIVSGIAVFAAVGTVGAQNVNEQYRQWQRAQERAQRECSYQRNRGDVRRCQNAQARAQREWMDYQRSLAGVNRAYNPYGGTTVYNPSTGQYYRIYRNGNYYQTDYRGYELLRQAVNSGYQQGYRQGSLDRRFGRGYNYYGNNVYMSGMYGYQSYVARNEYQYYFQQGFQRGYEDGYNNTFRYGYRSGSNYNILGNILGTILNLVDRP